MTIYIRPTKISGFSPQNPENDENDENGGCHSGKTMVYQNQGFHNPDYGYELSAKYFCNRPLLRGGATALNGQLAVLFSKGLTGARLSFLLQNPPTPEGFQKGL